MVSEQVVSSSMPKLPQAQFQLRIVPETTRARPAPVLVFKCSASGQHVNIHAFHCSSCCKTLWRFLFFSRSGALAVAGVANSIYVQQGMRVFHCLSLCQKCNEARRNKALRSYDPFTGRQRHAFTGPPRRREREKIPPGCDRDQECASEPINAAYNCT